MKNHCAIVGNQPVAETPPEMTLEPDVTLVGVGLTDERIGELAQAILDRSNSEAPNSNFQLTGWDRTKFGLIIQAMIATLRDEGLLAVPGKKMI